MIEDANPTPCAVFISCVSEGGISGGMLASAISDEGDMPMSKPVSKSDKSSSKTGRALFKGGTTTGIEADADVKSSSKIGRAVFRGGTTTGIEADADVNGDGGEGFVSSNDTERSRSLLRLLLLDLLIIGLSSESILKLTVGLIPTSS